MQHINTSADILQFKKDRLWEINRLINNGLYNNNKGRLTQLVNDKHDLEKEIKAAEDGKKS